MQEFEITAPDGRVVVVTGDKVPTSADLQRIFAALPVEEAKPEEKRSYASGVAHSALNGYFMGGGDEMAAAGQALSKVGPDTSFISSDPAEAFQKRAEWKEKYKEAYDPALEKERALQDEFVHNYPVSAFVAGVGGGMLNPFYRAVPKPQGTLLGSHTLAKSAAMGLSGAGFGGIYGFNEGRGGIDERLKSAKRSATFGGAVGAAIPFAEAGWEYVKPGIKSAISGIKKGIEKTPFVGGALGRNADDMALGAQDISGRLPDNGEITGTAVKNLADDIMGTVKTKSSALYDKAEKMAAGKPVLLDKNSNFAKAFDEVAKNATKSGRAELNRIWEEVGHTKYDAPTYETAKTFRSMLSKWSKNAGAELNGSQYGKLIEGLDRDIETSIGAKAMAARKAADAAYRNELANPDSITSSIEKLIGKQNKSVSEVGSRAIASAQGKAWKSSALKRLIDEGEKIGSPHVADVKQGLQANTVTRAQFNRMSPEQKIMVYGDKLPLAEKNFNGGVLNTLEKLANKTVDVASMPIEKLLKALRPEPIVSGMSAVQSAIK